MTEVTWYGHAAFKASTAKQSIIFDPFLDDNPTCTCSWKDIGDVDIVLITHDHADHIGNVIDICKNSQAKLACTVGTAEKLIAAGIAQEQVLMGIGFNMGGTVKYNNIKITMVPAFHTSESGTAVGYIVTMPDGFTIYHAGDTCLYGDMALWAKLYPIDLSLLPIGGVFTMDYRQAALACEFLKAKYVIPMHWGTFSVLAQNTSAFEQELANNQFKTNCIHLKPCTSHQF